MIDLKAAASPSRWTRLAGAASLAAILAVTGLAGPSTAAAETLRLAHNLGQGGKESLDPISRSRFFIVNQLLYDALIRPDADGRPSPGLAVAWSGSDDLMEWTLTLRDGVRFHDGTVFDSSDAVYSLRRIPSEVIKSPARSVLGIMRTVEAVDARTVRITLASPHADFPLMLMDYVVRMVSSEGRENDIDSLNETGIGTGAYKLVSLDAEGTTVLTANPDHWEGPPGADRVEVIAIPDSEARVQALLAGQIDLVRRINPQQRSLFEGRPGFQVQTFPTGNWNPLIMRTDTPPFDDARVRKALRLLADREAMIRTILGEGGGTVGCDTPVWPGDPYYTDLGCRRNIPAARRLLAEAGYADGLEVDLFTADVTAIMVQVAQIYQSQAADAGVTVNIRMVPSDGYWTTTWMKRPFVAGNWAQRPADQILNEAFRSQATWNETYWNRADFDAALDEARRTPDFAQRKALYAKIQRLLYEEGGAFVPFFHNQVRVFSDKLGNVVPIHDFFVRWHQVTKSG